MDRVELFLMILVKQLYEFLMPAKERPVPTMVCVCIRHNDTPLALSCCAHLCLAKMHIGICSWLWNLLSKAVTDVRLYLATAGTHSAQPGGSHLHRSTGEPLHFLDVRDFAVCIVLTWRPRSIKSAGMVIAQQPAVHVPAVVS